MNLRLHAAPDVGWRARLDLDFAARGRGTHLVRRRHEGPLVVQRAFHPEGPEVAHVYVLHPPGGVVGGDELSLHAHVQAGAHALLTTPGATKLYRSAGAAATLVHRLTVAPGAVVEWFPQETIVFSGARAELRLEVELAVDDAMQVGLAAPPAAFLGWDITCLGRPGSGEVFERGRHTSRVRVQRGGVPLYLERFEVDGGTPFLRAPWGLRGAPVLGSFLASVSAPHWPAISPLIDEVRRVHSPDGSCPDEWLGVTALAEAGPLEGRLSGVLLARYLGPSVERAKEYFIEIWRRVRPLLVGREVALPRIWAT
jgi:urease accessory protein